MTQVLTLFIVAALLREPPANPRPGQALNDNFVVSATTQELAEAVLEQAEELRKQIAREWLGEELPPGVGFTSICATLTEKSDDTRTFVADDKCRDNLMYLTTSRAKMLGSGLAHEITHTVLATQFRGKLPVWAEEGAASLRDDPERIALRRRIIQWFERTGNWPALREILTARQILPRDHAANTVAASLTEHLLSRGDRARFLEFAIAGKNSDWEVALHRFYGIRNVNELQGAWQNWARKQGE
jgi:hypothetical protein